MVTTVAQSFLREHFPSVPVCPISNLLVVKGPLDNKLPYEGTVELEVSLPIGGQKYCVGVFPVLVSPDTEYNSRTPVLVGTNVLEPFCSHVSKQYGDRAPSSLCQSVTMVIQALRLRNRHLDKTSGVYGLLKSKEDIVLKPHQTLLVQAAPQIVVPVPRSIALVQGAVNRSSPSSHQAHITPGVVNLNDSSVTVEMFNDSNVEVRIMSNTVVGEICQATLASGLGSSMSDDDFLDQFKWDDLVTDVSPEKLDLLKNLLLEQKSVFALSPSELGHTSRQT